MTKSISKELRDNCLLEIKKCLNKKCKIVKEVEPGKISNAKLLAVDPTNKNRLLFKLAPEDEFDMLLVEEGIYIFIGKN